MFFLNPAVLLGLLAAAIPVVIHLFNLRKLKKIDFSTLVFLKELQRNKIKKIKLKQWLLLALRVLIILLLVFAFSRPVVKGISIGGAASPAKTSTVFILDNSYSMSALEVNGSFINKGKENIKHIIQGFQEGDEAAIVTFSPDVNENNLTTNFSKLLQDLEGINISYNAGNLHSAIIKAGEILENSQNVNKEIIVISDFQKNQLYNENELSDLSSILGEDIKLYSFKAEKENISNLSIDKISLSTGFFEKDKPVSFDITISNTSNADVSDAVVSLFVNNERTSQLSFSIHKGKTKTITLQTPIKGSGLIDVYAQLNKDEIEYDNRRYIALDLSENIKLNLFSSNYNDLKYIDLVLNAVNQNSLFTINKNDNSALTQGNLQDDKVIVISGAAKLSNIQLLKNYVNSGGGLLLMPGANENINEYKSLLNKLNLPANITTVGSLSNPMQPMYFGKVEYDHPIFNEIFSEQGRRKIESPEIFYHFKYTPEGRGKNIITLQDGSAFLSEYQQGKGKILLLSVSPDLKWSDLPVKSFFPLLITRSIFYLNQYEGSSKEYITGEEIVAQTEGASAIKIVKPDKQEEIVNTNSDVIYYSNTDKVGNYKITSGERTLEYVPVNFDPKESNLKYANEDDIKDYLKRINYKGNYVSAGIDENPEKVLMESRFGSELWKILLLLALLTAIAEMLVARNMKKEMVE